MAFKNNFGIFKIPKDLGGVWIQTICIFSFFFFFLVVNVDFLCEQRIRALFTRPTNITFSSIFIKTGFYDIIHTFKNYFATLFSGQRFNICFFLFFLFLIENSVFT